MNDYDLALTALVLSCIALATSGVVTYWYLKGKAKQVESDIETLGYVAQIAARLTKLEKVPATTTDKPVAKVRAGVQKPVKKGIKNV